ncbi:MAG TPA: hypothetical protein VKX39_17230 [Bryobacteraceae bacterium]|jgi:hypothetical protein|nr:hypothetical protein [Bryobacteraceae bacterium]
MADRLYLSCWIARRNGGYSAHRALRYFENILGIFPFSKLAARGPALRIYALEHSEPPQFEREFSPGADPAALAEAAGEFMQDDSLAEVDTAWDLFQYEGDWKLAPAGVMISCFGPAFENEIGDQLRIDFGNDSRYLPDPRIEGGIKMGESNLKSLVHLIHEIERIVPLERRQLWSESGESPAETILKAISL